jgi:hypothetical protein
MSEANDEKEKAESAIMQNLANKMNSIEAN